jgi:hypothetical protein
MSPSQARGRKKHIALQCVARRNERPKAEGAKSKVVDVDTAARVSGATQSTRPSLCNIARRRRRLRATILRAAAARCTVGATAVAARRGTTVGIVDGQKVVAGAPRACHDNTLKRNTCE